MKKTKEDKIIKKMAKEVKTPKEKVVFFDNRLTRMERDWFFVVILGVLIMVAGISFSAYFYDKYRDSETLIQEGELERAYNERLVESAIQKLNLRTERYKNIIQANAPLSKNNQVAIFEKEESEDSEEGDDIFEVEIVEEGKTDMFENDESESEEDENYEGENENNPEEVEIKVEEEEEEMNLSTDTDFIPELVF